MAQRRMFSKEIIESDAFLDMPLTAQALYFHLGVEADDDGFVHPKKIMRILGSAEDDIKILLAKRFLLPFDSGVVVIKHWLIHNLIRADIYKETLYSEEKNKLGIKDNGIYTELREGIAPIAKIEPPMWLKKRRGGKKVGEGKKYKSYEDTLTDEQVSMNKKRLEEMKKQLSNI